VDSHPICLRFGVKRPRQNWRIRSVRWPTLLLQSHAYRVSPIGAHTVPVKAVMTDRWIPELDMIWHELLSARSESFPLTENVRRKEPTPEAGNRGRYQLVFFFLLAVTCKISTEKSPVKNSCRQVSTGQDVEPCIIMSARAAFFGTVSLRHATQRSCP
jgi:hypothetical protein